MKQIYWEKVPAEYKTQLQDWFGREFKSNDGPYTLLEWFVKCYNEFLRTKVSHLSDVMANGNVDDKEFVDGVLSMADSVDIYLSTADEITKSKKK